MVNKFYSIFLGDLNAGAVLMVPKAKLFFGCFVVLKMARTDNHIFDVLMVFLQKILFESVLILSTIVP